MVFGKQICNETTIFLFNEEMRSGFRTLVAVKTITDSIFAVRIEVYIFWTSSHRPVEKWSSNEASLSESE